jgi:hypothetical protein
VIGGQASNVLSHLVWVGLGDGLAEMMEVSEGTASPSLVMWIYLAWSVIAAVLLLNLLVGQTRS